MSYDDPDYDAQPKSRESTFVAYTDLFLGGKRWSVTIREGMDETQFDGLLVLLQYATKQLQAAEYSQEASPVPPSEAPESANLGQRLSEPYNAPRQPDRTPPAASGPAPARVRNDAEGGTERIVRVVTAGLIDDVHLELWSGNARLQFPFMKPKSKIAISALLREYPNLEGSDGVAKLEQPGRTMNVTWDIDWVRSPKNPSWKDLVAIRIVPKG